MYRFPHRRVFAVLTLLSLGAALSALTGIAHAETRPHHSRHLRTATSGHAVRRTHAEAVRARRRTVIAAHRRPARIAPREQTVAASIPAVPMKHFTLLPPMVGSHASLVRQNVRTEADGLDRIEDDAALNELRRTKDLVAVPVSAQLRINEGLPMNRRYCRPWTARFLVDLARAHATRFHRGLQVNSAVRTVEYQRSLMEVNGNAAPADGDIASPHLTGATIDIGKKGLSMTEVSWMRAYLLPLEQAGKIDVEEEFYQSCFHITVYKSYSSAPGTMMPKGRAASLLASGVR